MSLIFPGLGQFAAGSTRRAVLVAAPAVLLLAVAVGALLGDPIGVAAALIRSDVLGAVIGANVVLGLYHLVAITDAFAIARRARARVGRMSVAVLVGLLVLTIGIDRKSVV